MSFVIFLLFLVAMFGGIGICYIVFYNKLVDYKSKLEHAESIIDDCLRNKYDYLGEMNIQLSKIIEDKKSYLKDYESIKDIKITNFDFDRKLVEYISLINKLVEDHKNVSEDKDVKKVFKDIKDNDEKLNATKQYYNRYTALNNKTVTTFPSNIIAKIHGIKSRLFYDGKDMNDDIIDDFKV